MFLALSLTILLFEGVWPTLADDNYPTFVGFHNIAQMPYAVSDTVAVTFQENLFNDGQGSRIFIAGKECWQT